MHVPLSVAKCVDDKTARLALSGTLDSSLPLYLREEVLALVKPDCLLVLDLSRLTAISGQGLRMLLLLCRQVRAAEGSLVVEGASAELRDLAESAGFGDLFRESAVFPQGALVHLPRRRQIDAYPTHTIGGYAVRIGRPFPLGATPLEGGTNFAIYSRHATAVSLVLFNAHDSAPVAELPIPREFRTGDVFAMIVYGLDEDNIEYGFRIDGPHDAEHRHRFDVKKVLLDPQARTVSGHALWGGPRAA
jgi:anti-anti-sigma factor